MGFEPTRPLGQSGLSRPRLTEFRHPGTAKYAEAVLAGAMAITLAYWRLDELHREA